jgi:7-carboxy-7-deazaguanine synthase
MSTYALAPDGVYWSIQAEGHLRGQQMAFLRLAGCSVGCRLCDTDYSFDRRVKAEDLAAEVEHIMPPGLRDRWVWLTGGEPYDRDLHQLIKCFREHGFSIAVATSGVHRAIEPVDWLSVSPHGYNLLQRFGSELKLCEGLNDLDVNEWIAANPDSTTDFFMRYVQPLSTENPDGSFSESPESLRICLDFLKLNPNWSLSRQDHHGWGLK